MFTYDDVLSEVKDFIKSLNNNNKDIFRFLSLRFGISVELINNIIGKDYQYDFLRLDILEDKLHNDDFIDAVLANAKNERSNYLSYLNDHKIDSNTAFVDIGHNGSLQASICKLLNLDKSLGLYFATYDGVVDTLGSVPGSHIGLGYYRDKISTKERSDNYIKYALMIETLFLNDKGTFIKFIMDDGELIPKYLSVKNESKRVSFINTMQGGILKYVDDIKMTLGCLNIDLCNNTDFSKSFDPCERFFEIMRKPTLRDAKMFSGVTMENFFSGRDIRYITPEYNRLNVVCLWAEGTRRIKEHVAKEKENGKRDSSKNIVSKRRKSGLIKRHLAKATLRVTEHVYLMMSPFVNKRKVNKFKLDRELFYKDTKNRIIRNIWMSSK